MARFKGMSEFVKLSLKDNIALLNVKNTLLLVKITCHEKYTIVAP